MFTYEQHLNTGPTLKRLRDKLQRLTAEVAVSYGFNSKEGEAATAAIKAVDGLKSALDDAVLCEQPHIPETDRMRLYYGKEEG